MDVLPQTVIAGRYRIEREIGHGGMGTVFRAVHLGLERPVAVKILKSEFAASAEVTERFMREARTMARLRHSRAAIIFDAGKLDDNRPFIVMEYVEGVTLADTLARENRFTPERAVRVAAEICEVLAEAHRVRIVHRDLKPSNIMLTERGVVVLDFGIAKILQTTSEKTLAHTATDSGLIIGTPRYMSPEQCVGHTVGPASDLYSVGVLLYEMLAGRPPFIDTLQSAVLVKQATATPPLLLALRPDVPRSLALVVHTLLAKSPAHRPASAHDTRMMLQRSIVQDTVPTSTASVVAPFASTTLLMSSNRFAPHRIAAMILVLAMCGIALFTVARGINGNDTAALASSSSAHSNARAINPTPVTEPVRTQTASLTPSVLSLDAARTLAARVSRGSARSIGVIRMAHNGVGIVAINRRHSARGRTGAAYLFVMEQQGIAEEPAGWNVTRRASLDGLNAQEIETFRGAEWTTEVVDADDDGIDEVLCVARGARRDARRFVLYVPHTRRSYSLEVSRQTPNALHAVWSQNAQTSQAAPFRRLLQSRALAPATEPTERQRSF